MQIMNKNFLAYKLKEYVSSGILPMHMPGHKRRVPKEIEEIRDTKKNVRNHTCIVISTILPEGAPHLRVRWETSNGEIGEYTFYYNGFNGNSDMFSYRYKYTLKRKLMCIFGLN